MRGDVNVEQNEQNGLICAKIRVKKSSFSQTHQQTSGSGSERLKVVLILTRWMMMALEKDV